MMTDWPPLDTRATGLQVSTLYNARPHDSKTARVKAMILAAGRGQRLAPLTDTLPKPLVELGGRTLIEHHLARLVAVGVTDVVINVAHLGHLIEARLGDGRTHGVHIAWSREPAGALETGGGIFQALPLLGPDPFLVVNADVWSDCALPRALPGDADAHLVLVPNPPHHPAGDFTLADGRVRRGSLNPLTYAGVGVFSPALFAGCAPGRFPLAPLLFAAGDQSRLSGEIHTGRWFDIGTLERLAAARAALETA